MGFHKTASGKIIDHGGNPRYRHGEIIRPGFNRRCHLRFLRIRPCQIRQLLQIFLQKIYIFIAASDSRPRSMRQCRQFKIQIRNDLSYPLRMRRKHLLIGSRGPVKVGINHPPFLRRHGTDYNGIFRLYTTPQKCPGNSKHHGNRCIVILKTAEIGIIMG